MIRRREVEEVGLSFLDIICCGFGAIILLLLITRIASPLALESDVADIIAQVAKKKDALELIRGETTVLEQERLNMEQLLDTDLEELARLQVLVEQLTREYEALVKTAREESELLSDLFVARQSLTDEMQRLLGSGFRRETRTIGGIAVDSEYIIFVIDTSGSMQTAWAAVVNKLQQTLQVHPIVKGIQVLNDEGKYLFPQFTGDWISDTPARRRAILERMQTWAVFSDSSPVEGIREAVQSFYDPTKKISVYVFGDDFTSRHGDVSYVVRQIDAMNIDDEEGNCRVRIHTVGFPVHLQFVRVPPSALRFATLMRELAKRNCGTFVGLPFLH